MFWFYKSEQQKPTCKLLPINSPISRQTSPIDTIELLKENKQKQDSM